MIIDSHIHLSQHLYGGEFPYLCLQEGAFGVRRGQRGDLIQDMREAGICACIDPGVELPSNRRILDLAAAYPGYIYPAVGVHPTRTFRYRVWEKNGERRDLTLRLSQRRELEAYARDPAVVAIGETGLDYHLERREQHRLRQKYWFLFQLKLAHRLEKPLILHIRAADRDALGILRRHRRLLHGGVVHCFSGPPEMAEAYVELGLMLGIGGALLMEGPGQDAFAEAVARTPLEHLLLETDGPYVKPPCPGLTGKERKRARNTSLILPAVSARIAALKGISQKEVERVTAENAERLFHLKISEAR